MELRCRQVAVALTQSPFGLFPLIRLGHGDLLRQIEAGHRGRAFGRSYRLVDNLLCDFLAFGQTHDRAVLRALGAQDAGQLTGVDVGNCDRTSIGQISRKGLTGAEVARDQGQVFDDQASSMDLVGFDVFPIDAVVTNVRVRQGDDLLAVAGVGEDFLVAGERGVEHHFADCGAGGSDRVANKDRAVCERQNGGREGSLKRQKHWVLRNSSGTPQTQESNTLRATASVGSWLGRAGAYGLMRESLPL